MSGKIVCTLNEVWKGSQKELSQKSGVNKNTLTAWFHNKIKRMDLDTLLGFALQHRYARRYISFHSGTG